MPKLSIDALLELLKDALGRALPVADGMKQVIALCERAQPHPDWGKLRKLDVDADLCHLEQWLQGVLERESPAPSITGLWFGVFNPIKEGQATADLYVAGNPYDPNNSDWVCNPKWWPDGRYAESKVMDRIYRVAHDPSEDHLGNDAEYPLCLAYGILAVTGLARRVEPPVLLGKAHERALTGRLRLG
jgi:hypothetical protein